MKLLRSEAILAVRDVVQTTDYYRAVLGFETHWLWGNPPTFGGVQRDGVSLMFNQQPELAGRVGGHEHYFKVDDARAFYDLHKSRGARIVGEIENKPWGHLEYVVEDPNGYRLRFGGPEEYVRPATATEQMPDHYRIDPTPPAEAVVQSLKRSVNWNPGSLADFGQPWGWVVAIDTRSQTPVGCARAMRDGDTWFSIWDVIVHPDHQHQKIGTAMLEHLIARIKAAHRSGIIHLFAYKPGFYATLGFKSETAELLRF